MCLITVCDPTIRPNPESLKQSRAANGHGSGIAWTDGKLVRWHKGLIANEKAEEVTAALAQVPNDSVLVIHDRLATVGGQSYALSHPFPIERDVRLTLKGSTSNAVLFHNGHWRDWQTFLFPALASARIKLPKGPWSDSRAIAFLVWIYGEGFIDAVIPDQRVCILGPEGYALYGDWKEHDRCSVSNLNWKRETKTYGAYMRDEKGRWQESKDTTENAQWWRKKESDKETDNLTDKARQWLTKNEKPGQAITVMENGESKRYDSLADYYRSKAEVGRLQDWYEKHAALNNERLREEAEAYFLGSMRENDNDTDGIIDDPFGIRREIEGNEK